MIQIRTKQFIREANRFALQYTCEACALYDGARKACVHGYPTGDHRGDIKRVEGDLLIFCKDFELL